MKPARHIIFLILFHLAFFFLHAFSGKCAGLGSYQDEKNAKADTIPKSEEPARKGIRKYIHILTDKQQRDSLMAKLSRQNEPPPTADSILWKQRQNNFAPYRGKIIRNIYYNQLEVFGTIIDDTAYTTSQKLVRFANRLHYNTREWMIRQSLFFRENDTVNAYKMVENERYLRSLPFIQDARFYVINTYLDPDSIDLVVLTKDVFEYGGTLSSLTPTSIGASVYNNNAFGAGQNLLFGFQWDETFRPQWRGQVSYSKYNVGGSFADVAVGYSALNNQTPVDTGVYERSYYFSVNRPLYSSWAKLTGGVTLSFNQSVNIHSYPDTVYRQYQYTVFDIWGGYNFRNQFKNNGLISNKPNLAIELRQYNLHFTQNPAQHVYDKDPNYNDHQYVLGRFVLFHQDFFKTNYFFGYGRTEDVPTGYNASLTIGTDHWVGLNRLYTAIEGQKYWLTKRDNLYNLAIGAGSFWNDSSEDAVFHIQANSYSRLLRWGKEKFRQFFHVDWLSSPNHVLYKPLNINRDNGLFGYRNTMLNGYKRLNISAETMYYSRISIYGFKFNFFALLQASLLENPGQSIFKSPFYSGMGLGFSVRNENLAFNTLSFSATYLPPVQGAPKSFFAEISTTAPLNFNIFALQAPALIPFK